MRLCVCSSAKAQNIRLNKPDIDHEENYGQRDLNMHEYIVGVNEQYTVSLQKLTIGSYISLYSQNEYEAEYMNNTLRHVLIK